MAWRGGEQEGNPDYFYTHLMTGLRTFTCSTCLCDFGCMTAQHRCPHCRRPYLYTPGDYHRKV